MANESEKQPAVACAVANLDHRLESPKPEPSSPVELVKCHCGGEPFQMAFVGADNVQINCRNGSRHENMPPIVIARDLAAARRAWAAMMETP